MSYNETETAIAKPDMKLFYACLVALVTTAFGFILRARDIVIFPLIMLVSYLMLIFYFRSKGGYRAVDLKNELP